MAVIPVASIEVTPSEIVVRQGDREALSSIARESGGRELPGRTVEWVSDDPAIASVSADGLVEGRSQGETWVHAISESVKGSAQVTVRPRPLIHLPTTLLDFQGAAGDPTTQEATIAVQAGGTGSIAGLQAQVGGTGGAPPSWLVVALGSGSAPTELRIQVSTRQLQAGSYEATVAVLAPEAEAEPAELTVRVQVSAATPRLAVSPNALQLEAQAGSTATPTGSVTIQNSGGGALGPLVIEVHYPGGSPSGWLSTELSGAQAPATLTIQGSARTLVPGEYSATVRVRAPAAVDGHAEVAVAFRVTGLLLIHPEWPVTLPPGAVIVDLEARGDRLRYRLLTPLDFEAVYDRLHPELVADGWRLREIDRKRDKVEAEYRRGRYELDVTVERDGQRVRVTLELDD